MLRDNMVIVLITKEEMVIKFPMMITLSTSLVLFVNTGAGRPNVTGFECLCLLCCPVMFSLSLSPVSSWSFISSWKALWIASQVLHTAQCPGWRRLTQCATVGTRDYM